MTSNTYSVTLCLYDDFKSQRGLRKHIDNKHSWYILRRTIKSKDLPVFPDSSKKVSTVHKPSLCR